MIFTELPEEFWPQNFQFPTRVEVDFEAFTQAVAEAEFNTHDYDTGAPFMFIFADAKHVEFAEAYTGKLLFPPEMFMVPIFKSMAKSKGPFVIGAQYGFRQRNSSFPHECRAKVDDVYTHRFFAPFKHAYIPGYGSAYDFSEILRRKVAKHLDLRRYSSRIGIVNTSIFQYQILRYNVTTVLIHENEHLYCAPETTDENE